MTPIPFLLYCPDSTGKCFFSLLWSRALDSGLKLYTLLQTHTHTHAHTHTHTHTYTHTHTHTQISSPSHFRSTQSAEFLVSRVIEIPFGFICIYCRSLSLTGNHLPVAKRRTCKFLSRIGLSNCLKSLCTKCEAG